MATDTPHLSRGGPLTATTSPPTSLAVLHPTGTLSHHALPNPTPAPPLPPLSPLPGRPSALAFRQAPPRTLVGTTDGALFLGARLLATLPGAPLAAVAFAASGPIAAGGAARELLLLDAKGVVHARHSLAAAHRAPISALALDPARARAAVCSQAVTLVDLASGATLRRYAGHASPVTDAVMLPGARRFATACEGDRYISVWDAAAEKKDASVGGKRRRKAVAATATAAAATLVAPESGVLRLVVDEFEESGVSLAAVLKSGAVAVWRNWTEKGGSGGCACSFVVRPEGRDRVFQAVFQRVGVLTVLYGSELKPNAKSFVLHDVEEQEVVLPEGDGGLLLRDRGRRGDKETAAVVKAAGMKGGSSVAPMQVEGRKQTENGFGAVGEEGQPWSGSGESDSESEGGREGEGEPSIQERLMALGVSNDVDNIPGVRDFVGVSQDKAVIGSRVSVLLQAVRSKDSDLFDKSIERVRNKALIQSTVERVPPEVAAGGLLDMLVNRLQIYPTRAENLVRWIRAVLLEHASALISRKQNVALTALMAIVNERTEALDGLARLEGRLELVVGQAERLQRAGRSAKLAEAVPVAEYNEEEGSEGYDDDEEESSSDDSDDSASDRSMDEGEAETRPSPDSGDSVESDSNDESMEEAERRPEGALGKGPGTSSSARMNGHADGDGESSSSEEVSDEGD